MLLYQLQPLAQHLSEAECVVFVTGAGLSSESGLPVGSEFHDSLGNEYGAEFSTYGGFQSDPEAAWHFYDRARCAIATARPSPSHIALVEMEKLVRRFVLATHNIDRLHQITGNKTVIELSGSIWELRCEADGFLCENYAAPLEALPPRCSCGSILRPNVVFPGEVLATDPYNQLRAAITNHRGTLFFVGISGRNTTMLSLVSLLKTHGWRIVEINPRSTPLSPSANLLIRQTASYTLPPLAEHLTKLVAP